MTSATSKPSARRSWISRAMRATTSGSRPNWRAPMSASPDSFRRRRRYFEPRGSAAAARPIGRLLGRRRGLGAAGFRLPEDEAREPPDPDALTGLRDDVVNDFLHRHRGIAHERLLQEAGLLVVLLHLAGDDLLDHRL